MNFKKTLAALAVGAVLAVASPLAAAADQPGYVLVAWKIGNPDAIWETPQQYVSHILLDEPTLDALDGTLPCGADYQIDLYLANNDSAALIAGGVLVGPNNPTEPLAHGAVDGDPWKYLHTETCVGEPEPRVFSDEQQTSDCESTTTTTRTGFFALDFDPIANRWTERPEPTITGQTSTKAPVSVEAQADACPVEEQLPTLAETGIDGEAAFAWIFGAVVLLISGIAATRTAPGAGTHRKVRGK